MFKITDCKVESRKREDLYHFAPPELYECAKNGSRGHPFSELHSVACHGVQNESYCTANQLLDGLSDDADARRGTFFQTAPRPSLDFSRIAH
jgi:hypothetical protein